MSKISETDDREPFELGGWNGDSATGGAPNRAGEHTPGEIGMAPQPGSLLAADDPPNRSKTMPDGSVSSCRPEAIWPGEAMQGQNEIERSAGDAKLCQLFAEWLQGAAPASGWPEDDDASDAQLDLVHEIENAIEATPASGPVGLALKILVIGKNQIDFGLEQGPDGTCKMKVREGDYTETGYLADAWYRSLLRDAVRFAPELLPIVEEVLAAPVRLPGYSGEDEPDPLGIGQRIVAEKAAKDGSRPTGRSEPDEGPIARVFRRLTVARMGRSSEELSDDERRTACATFAANAIRELPWPKEEPRSSVLKPEHERSPFTPTAVRPGEDPVLAVVARLLETRRLHKEADREHAALTDDAPPDVRRRRVASRR
jgi:hypothetical protein